VSHRVKLVTDETRKTQKKENCFPIAAIACHASLQDGASKALFVAIERLPHEAFPRRSLADSSRMHPGGPLWTARSTPMARMRQ